jgi:hypothetical protein
VRLWLLRGAIALLAAGCASGPYERSLTVYPFRRPVTGIDGNEVDIADRDWFECDLRADKRATRTVESLNNSSDTWTYDPNPLSGFFSVALSAGILATNPGDTTYEREMRGCLVERGYAVTPPEPLPAFGQKCDQAEKDRGGCTAPPQPTGQPGAVTKATEPNGSEWLLKQGHGGSGVERLPSQQACTVRQRELRRTTWPAAYCIPARLSVAPETVAPKASRATKTEWRIVATSKGAAPEEDCRRAAARFRDQYPTWRIECERAGEMHWAMVMRSVSATAERQRCEQVIEMARPKHPSWTLRCEAD